MSNVPQYYFGDIPAEEMQEIVNGMMVSEHAQDFLIAQCESRNHKVHRGDLWQCSECLRVFCWEEGADDGALNLGDDCWSRLHALKPVVAFA